VAYNFVIRKKAAAARRAKVRIDLAPPGDVERSRERADPLGSAGRVGPGSSPVGTAQRSSALHDVLETSTGSRTQGHRFLRRLLRCNRLSHVLSHPCVLTLTLASGLQRSSVSTIGRSGSEDLTGPQSCVSSGAKTEIRRETQSLRYT
jgi:hypothetical protein